MLVLLKKSSGEFELTDIEPEEISFVDRPANKRKFVVVKRDGESGGQIMPLKLTKDEKEMLAKAMLTIKDRTEHIDKAIADAEEVDEVEKSDRAGIETLVAALEESLQALKKKADDPTPPPAPESKQQVQCANCQWKGEMPADGICPKCGASLKKEGDAKGGEDTKKQYDEVKTELAKITEALAALKTQAASPAPDADVKKSIDAIAKSVDATAERVTKIEKSLPSYVASNQPPDEADKPNKGVWAQDMAVELAEEEARKAAAAQK